MLVEIINAAFGYQNRPVVQVESLQLHPGRCLGIFGPNGAGKTTLVRGISGLLKPISGQVKRTREEIKIAYLPQHRAMDLCWPMTGFDAAAMSVSASRPMGWLGRSKENILKSMQKLDVLDLENEKFSRLSGGQQQRLLLAGALAVSPDLLILDEPTDGLDVSSCRKLLDMIRQLIRGGLCTVMISHEVEDLLFLSHEIAHLHSPEDIVGPSRIELVSVEDFAHSLVKSGVDR